MRLGLIGAGRWGRRYIATISAMPEARLARLASSNPDSKNLVPDGCIITPDWQDLIAAADLDGIIIATPPHTHMSIALAAIEAGLPVLIEKPLTLALSEAQRIAEAAARCKVLTVVDHTHLHGPAYRELKRLGSTLGPLKSLYSSGANWGPFRPDTPVLWDYAPHDIAMCIDLAGQPPVESEASIEKETVTEEGTGAAIQLLLRFAGQVNARIRVSNVDRHKNRLLRAVYEGGTLCYDDLREPKLTFNPAPDSAASPAQREIPVASTPPLTVAVREFCGKIAAAECADPSLDLGISVVEILAECARKLDEAALSARD